MWNRIITIITLLIVSFMLSIHIYAHPGRTDRNGCHICRTNCELYGLEYGEYHCHNNSSKQPSSNDNSSISSSNNSFQKDNDENGNLYNSISKSIGDILIYVISIAIPFTMIFSYIKNKGKRDKELEYKRYKKLKKEIFNDYYANKNNYYGKRNPYNRKYINNKYDYLEYKLEYIKRHKK